MTKHWALLVLCGLFCGCLGCDAPANLPVGAVKSSGPMASLGPLTIDATTQQSFHASFDAMVASVDETQQPILISSLNKITITDPFGIREQNKERTDMTKDEKALAVFKPLHGWTAQQIIDKGNTITLPQ